MKRNLLLERDMLLFDPWDAIKLQGEEAIKFRKTSGFGITLRVYGTLGTSDLTGERTVEDMEVRWGDKDVTNGCPESFLQDLVHECVENN